jgi:hypothetical protein
MGQQFHAVHARHFDITQDQIKFGIGQDLQGLKTITGQSDLKTLAFKDFLEAIPDGGLVVNNQYAHWNV